MTPLELRARREALGLSQGLLASLLGNAQNTVSQWENGRRAIPGDVDETLARYEEVVESLVDEAGELLDGASADGVPVALQTYSSDESLWEAVPALVGVPSVLHRVALARARVLADVPCRIV